MPLGLSWRGCAAAAALGVLFTFITLRLTLGSAGMTPPLTVPAGLLSYVLLKGYTKVVPRAAAFHPQENAVVQTMATSCYKIVGFAGYGSYLTALSYPIYLQMGGIPKGQPGYQADSVVDPDLHRVYPFLLLIAFGGIFALLGLRVLLIIKWRLPFPSGTASASMINSLHRSPAAASPSAAADAVEQGLAGPVAASGAAYSSSLPPCGMQGLEAVPRLKDSDTCDDSSSSSSSSQGPDSSTDQLAARKIKVLAYTALGSFLFDAFKWLFQGSGYGCGFANWPTFGLAAAKWTWRFDFMQQYIGSGFLVPHVVAWSMLLGAVISWGIMWPQLAAREGSWYPAGLSYADMRGLAGYKIFLSVALLLGEGGFIMIKAALLGIQHLRALRRQRQHHQSYKLATDHSSNTHHSCSPTNRASSPQHMQQHTDQTHDAQLEPSCSTPCSLHSSQDACAASDVRLRVTANGRTSDGPRAFQESRLRQQQVLPQQDFSQLQQLQDAQGVSVDAHAVLSEETEQGDGWHKHQAGAPADTQGLAVPWGATLRHRGPKSAVDSGPGCSRPDGSDGSGDGGIAGATFQETAQERSAREAVFLSDSIPSWLGPAGYGVLTVLGVGCIPLVYPAARWYMVLVAFLLGPPVALANGFGAGLTDVDNSANYSTVAMFLFAAWAAATGGNGIVAGCVLSGVLMVFSVSAAVLLQDLRTGYMTLTPPSSMLIAQVLGAVFGVLFSPLAFALFWSTGQVGRPDGPYPAPFAGVTRGMASIGVDGFGALPRYCGLLSGLFFVAAFAICTVRELLPARYARFVPSPMAMAFPFFIPASNAIDFWLGSVIVMIWEWKSPASAAHYAPLAGAGLLVGDGLWSIPAALLAIANVSPPMCMKFE